MHHKRHQTAEHAIWTFVSCSVFIVFIPDLMSFLVGFERVSDYPGTFRPIWPFLAISLFFGGMILFALLNVPGFSNTIITITFFLFIFGAAQISTCVEREEMNLWHRALTEKSDYWNLLDGDGRLDEKKLKERRLSIVEDCKVRNEILTTLKNSFFKS